MQHYEVLNNGLFETMIRFAFNLIIALIVLRLIYYPRSKNREHLFTMLIFNVVVFFITALLSEVKMKTAVGFGLFAIFSILRYRTEQVPIKEMTFLFLSITLATINAWNTAGSDPGDKSPVSIIELVLINAVIVIITFVLDRTLLGKLKNESQNKGQDEKDTASFTLSYTGIAKFKETSNTEIIEEFKAITSLDIFSIKVKKIDVEADKVDLNLYYFLEDQ